MMSLSCCWKVELLLLLLLKPPLLVVRKSVEVRVMKKMKRVRYRGDP